MAQSPSRPAQQHVQPATASATARLSSTPPAGQVRVGQGHTKAHRGRLAELLPGLLLCSFPFLIAAATRQVHHINPLAVIGPLPSRRFALCPACAVAGHLGHDVVVCLCQLVSKHLTGMPAVAHWCSYSSTGAVPLPGT
jgi:hypothetical protein